MKTEIIPNVNLELGLFDSANGQSVIAYKIVDATDICPKEKRCVIKYAKVVRGTIAQVCRWYEPDVDLGMTVHYHIDKMPMQQLADDIVFKSISKVMGVQPEKLAQFVIQNK